jgi:clan AA aspartic protease
MLTLTILDRNDNGHAIQFIVDTGFTGQVLLPERYIRRLGLIMDSWFEGRPATGEVTNILAGEAIIIWQGQRRDVHVLQLDSEPLLGMELLWNNRIAIDAVADGAVTVTPLGG